MFMAPAITPWFSTLPGTGSNNPGVRLYKYSLNSEKPYIVDYSQYFINLTKANAIRRADWVEEYQATDVFGIRSLRPSELHKVISNFQTDTRAELFDRYYLYNSVSQDVSKCVGICKIRQICAARNVDYDEYADCVDAGGVLHRADVHHGRRHAHRVIEEYTYFIIGALVIIIVLLFVLIALCCCHRRHTIFLFRRPNYIVIQDSA